MKESRAEWTQLNRRHMPGSDLEELRYALREARRNLERGEPMSELTKTCFAVFGVDYSGLVPDFDGDAPDRFKDAPLDWSWKKSPAKETPYHQARERPRVGDRVRRAYSNAVGLVTAFHPHGSRGYVVRVQCGPLQSYLGMSRLVLVEPVTDERLVHWTGWDGIPCGTNEDHPLVSNHDNEVSCPGCNGAIDREGARCSRFRNPAAPPTKDRAATV